VPQAFGGTNGADNVLVSPQCTTYIKSRLNLQTNVFTNGYKKLEECFYGNGKHLRPSTANLNSEHVHC